jgi:phage terminase large subunit-like protein
MWCDSSDVWIPDNYILDASTDLRMADFEGQDCWIGVDLAATSDLTAVAFMFIRDEIPHSFVKYYLPHAALHEKRFALQYSEWKRQGALTITQGNVTDYDYITNDIMAVSQKVNIISIAYDTWNAISWAAQMEEKGMPLTPYSQSLGNFNRPTREIERLLLSGKVKVDNNVITRHCFRNVTLARDHNGNIKPTKKFAEKRIDGVIAILESIGIYYMTPRYGEFY